MLWSPTGPTVPATISPAPAARFVPLTSGNLGGVARLVNLDAAPHTFTIGSSTVQNTPLTTTAIPLAIGQDIVIAYGPDDTHISASSASIFITPGIGRP